MSAPLLPRWTVASIAEAETLPIFARREEARVEARATVQPILADVAARGDVAVREWSLRLDGAAPEALPVPLDNAGDSLAVEPRAALALAAKRIRAFHARTAPPRRIAADDGLPMWRVFEPYRSVGVYVPGGRAAYPSSLLMLAIPARLAGAERIVAATPPVRDGTVPEAVRFAARLAGVDRLYAMGGAQAVAALAFGTESVAQVDCIAGPGNRYVTAAKELLADRLAIDLPAGPSEIALLADGAADAGWAAADVLAQLEHDPDARALVVATDAAWLDALEAALTEQLDRLATGPTIRRALGGSAAVLVPGLALGADVVAVWAPEHLALCVSDPDALSSRVRNAGAVFVGGRSPVALGDYLAGPNHTLPTSGAARRRGGVGVETFGRWVAWVGEAPAAVVAPLAAAAATIADLEGLPAHAASLRIRAAGAPFPSPEISARRRSPAPSLRVAEFVPYTAAGHAAREGLLFDANESAWGPVVPEPAGEALHRYPDATYAGLRAAGAAFAGVEPDRVVFGNGSDELLDLALRAFADPGDAVVVAEPGYGMVRTLASLNGLAVPAAVLPAEGEPPFALDPEAFLAAAAGARVAVLCSPNNPTGNRLADAAVRVVVESFPGLVIVDEAYVEFSAGGSLAGWTEEHPNLCVLRTLSKAWGLAGLRVGYAIASREVAATIERVRPPYNVSRPAMAAALRAFAAPERLAARVTQIVAERERLAAGLAALGLQPWPSDANFLLIPATDATAIVRRLAEEWGIRVRDRSGLPGLPPAFRITVGRPSENDVLLDALAEILGRRPAPAEPGVGAAAEYGAAGRRAVARRATRETRVAIAVDIDRAGDVSVATGLPFFDHMIELLLAHAGVSATVAASGDLAVDAHHTVEDVGLALGEALDRALGDRAGVGRYGFLLPMDESLAEVALDLSGRPLLVFEGAFSCPEVGGLPTELVPEFLRALATRLRATLHVRLRRGGNAHHEVEGCFKAVGRALGQAVRRDPTAGGRVPSTKGEL